MCSFLISQIWLFLYVQQGILLYVDVLDVDNGGGRELLNFFQADLESKEFVPGHNITQPQNFGGVLVGSSITLSFQVECQPGFVGEDCRAAPATTTETAIIPITTEQTAIAPLTTEEETVTAPAEFTTPNDVSAASESTLEATMGEAPTGSVIQNDGNTGVVAGAVVGSLLLILIIAAIIITIIAFLLILLKKKDSMKHLGGKLN